jgi:hypothetical protein
MLEVGGHDGEAREAGEKRTNGLLGALGAVTVNQRSPQRIVVESSSLHWSAVLLNSGATMMPWGVKLPLWDFCFFWLDPISFFLDVSRPSPRSICG